MQVKVFKLHNYTGNTISIRNKNIVSIVSAAVIYLTGKLSNSPKFFMGILQLRQQANEFRGRTDEHKINI
jgi:hypothetical protein